MAACSVGHTQHRRWQRLITLFGVHDSGLCRGLASAPRSALNNVKGCSYSATQRSAPYTQSRPATAMTLGLCCVRRQRRARAGQRRPPPDTRDSSPGGASRAMRMRGWRSGDEYLARRRRQAAVPHLTLLPSMLRSGRCNLRAGALPNTAYASPLTLGSRNLPRLRRVTRTPSQSVPPAPFSRLALQAAPARFARPLPTPASRHLTTAPHSRASAVPYTMAPQHQSTPPALTASWAPRSCTSARACAAPRPPSGARGRRATASSPAATAPTTLAQAFSG